MEGFATFILTVLVIVWGFRINARVVALEKKLEKKKEK